MVYLAEPNRKHAKASKKRFVKKANLRNRRSVRPDGTNRLIARKRQAARRAFKVTVVREPAKLRRPQSEANEARRAAEPADAARWQQHTRLAKRGRAGGQPSLRCVTRSATTRAATWSDTCTSHACMHHVTSRAANTLS